MTKTREFPFPIICREDRERLELIERCGEYEGWFVREVRLDSLVNDIMMATIVVYDKDWQA